MQYVPSDWSQAMFHKAPSEFTIGPAFCPQEFRRMPPPVQFTVPALVSAPAKYRFPLVRLNVPLVTIVNVAPKVPPARLNTPLPATISGPLTVPPARLKVPVTVFVPAKVVPASVRLVIAPPWKPGPSTTVPPNRFKFGTTSLSNCSVPLPFNCTVPGPATTTPATLKFPPLN